MESLARPSLPDVIAEAVDASRGRPQARFAGSGDPGPCAAVEAVLGLLRDLKESRQVKGYAPDVWVGLGVHRGGTAHSTELLWWSVAKWREAAASGARRDLAAVRRAEAQREEERARRVSGVRAAVEEVLERRREDARNPYAGPDPL